VIYLYLFLVFWLWLATFGNFFLYVGFGFSMSAKVPRDDGRSQRWVVAVDTAIALMVVILDALENLLVFPFIALDPRPGYLFRKVTFKGYTLWVPDLVTARLTRYTKSPTEWAYRRRIAAVLEPFLGPKDPRGFHIEGVTEHITWLD
jgi:hypothetical protein